jgi:hypothetical protein
MPRAALTPTHADLFGGEATADLPIVNNFSAPPALPSLPAPAPSRLCIRDVDIATHIDFKVSASGANLSRWKQVLTLLLTMYKCLDHVTEGTAPAAPSDDWLADDIHIYLWFMRTLADAGAWVTAPEDSLCVANDQPVGNPKRKV